SGSFFIFLSSLGLLRFPDVFTRMHAAAKASSFGLGLMLLGTAFYFQNWFVILEAFLVILFVFLTAPIASHTISRAAYFLGVRLWEKTRVDEWKSADSSSQNKS
ncbi:MAG: monovalent cation/H(+) antiporter subunit G, partial [Calditrichaeota bacterium]